MLTHSEWRPVFAGNRVYCPRLAEEVDLARCIGCSWLLDLDRSGGTPSIRCDVEDSAAWPAGLVRREDHVD